MRTLVLNAGYEPLAVVSFRRALVLVLAGKATVIADGGNPVVGGTLTLPRPSVILLARYVRAPHGRAVPVSRRGVLRRDAHRCAYCGGHATTVDHVLPRSRGGRTLGEPRRLLRPVQQRQGRPDAGGEGLAPAGAALRAARRGLGGPGRRPA